MKVKKTTPFDRGTTIEFFDKNNRVKFYGVVVDFKDNFYFVNLFLSDMVLKVHRSVPFFRESKLKISQIIQLYERAC